MTEYVNRKIICANCKTTQEVLQVICTTEHGATDLDTRPPMERRKTMHTWAAMCKSCGYCSNDITRVEPIQQYFLQTQQYKEELNTPSSIRPVLANIFLCASLLDEVIGDSLSACWNSLRAAWCCDDAELDNNPYIPTLQQPLEINAISGSSFPKQFSPLNIYNINTNTQVRMDRYMDDSELYANIFSPPDSKRNVTYKSESIQEEQIPQYKEKNREIIHDSTNDCDRTSEDEEWSLTNYFRRNWIGKPNREPYLFQLEEENIHLLRDIKRSEQSKKCRIRTLMFLEKLRPKVSVGLEREEEELLDRQYVKDNCVSLVDASFFQWYSDRFPSSDYSSEHIEVDDGDHSMEYGLWIQLVIDTLRRISQFNVAERFIRRMNYKSFNSYMKSIIRFQLRLCREKDSTCHNFGELF